MNWCTFERSYYPSLAAPYDSILVELDEGPLFLSNPHGFDCQRDVLGLPVRVAFLDCQDEAGTFRLPVFERVPD